MVVVTLLLGAVALWGASRMTWAATFRDAGVRGMVLDTRHGAEEAVSLVPLAVLAVAGVAGMVATGGWARRVLGLILVLAGLGACWAGVDGLRLSGYPAGIPAGQIITGHLLAVLGGILVLAGGLLGTRNAGRMPRLGARYAAPGGKTKATDPDAELWEALSDGDDPTATEGR
jgi:hypothetical protein